MRVTSRMMTENSIKYMGDSLSDYNDAMELNSLGKQFRWASENPANAVESLNLKSTLAKGEAYIETAKSTNLWMTATTSAIGSMETLAQKANNLTLQGLSDTMGEDQRAAIAGEINMILVQAVGVGNTRHLGDYVFAGFQTSTQPFTLDTNPAPPPSQVVTYHGDAGNIRRNIGPETPIVANTNGTLFNGSGHDVFAALINIRDALQAVPFDRTAVESNLTSLQESLDYISQQKVDYAGRQRQLNDAIERMETTEVELKSLLSQKEDANMAEAVAILKQRETTYQRVLNVSSQALSASSLFEYLD